MAGNVGRLAPHLRQKIASGMKTLPHTHVDGIIGGGESNSFGLAWLLASASTAFHAQGAGVVGVTVASAGLAPPVTGGGATDTTKLALSMPRSTWDPARAARAASMASGIPFRLESGPVITKSATPSLFKSMPSCAMGQPIESLKVFDSKAVCAEDLLEVAPPAGGDAVGEGDGAAKRC